MLGWSPEIHTVSVWKPCTELTTIVGLLFTEALTTRAGLPLTEVLMTRAECLHNGRSHAPRNSHFTQTTVIFLSWYCVTKLLCFESPCPAMPWCQPWNIQSSCTPNISIQTFRRSFQKRTWLPPYLHDCSQLSCLAISWYQCWDIPPLFTLNVSIRTCRWGCQPWACNV